MARYKPVQRNGLFVPDEQRQARVDELRKQAQATRDSLATRPKRLNREGAELKINVTDPNSAKMATGKGVIQGYAAQAAVDSANQLIVAADVTGSGSEQAMLVAMIERAAGLRAPDILITADAGYFSDENILALRAAGRALTPPAASGSIQTDRRAPTARESSDEPLTLPRPN